LIDPPQSELTFLADAMLGTLARWLRVMGVDVAYHRDLDDAELVAQARAEGRHILTRDTLLIRRRWVREHHLFIRDDHLPEQLRQVVTAFGLDPCARFLSRCLTCNVPLQPVDRSSVAGRVPPYVFSTQLQFATCPACGRFFWGATHQERMAERLAVMLGLA
jgi:hypothetical protein